jgi:hypothetical protein
MSAIGFCGEPVDEIIADVVSPKGDPGFHAILAEMGTLHDKKQADYGTPGDPFANYRSSEDIGIPAWKNAFLRTTEKVNRVKSFIRNGRLENEGIEDAFMDIAVTAIISLLTYRQDKEKKETVVL